MIKIFNIYHFLDDLYKEKRHPDAIEMSLFFRMGRIEGFEPSNDRFTAGCVWPLHHIRQVREIFYLFPLTL